MELPEIQSLTLAAQQGDTAARGKLMVQFQGYGRKLVFENLKRFGYKASQEDIQDILGYIPIWISMAIDYTDVSKGSILGLMVQIVHQKLPVAISKLSQDNRHSWLAHCRDEEISETKTVELSPVAAEIIPDDAEVQAVQEAEDKMYRRYLLQYALEHIKLRPKTKAVIQRVIDGEKVQDIADDLGVSKQAVSFLWVRHQEKMKESLTPLPF